MDVACWIPLMPELGDVWSAWIWLDESVNKVAETLGLLWFLLRATAKPSFRLTVSCDAADQK